MKPLPQTENPLVLRTGFSSEAVWQKICTAIQKPVGIFRFRANLEFLDDPQYTGMTKEQLLGLVPKNHLHSFIVVVDQPAISHPDHPRLIVSLLKSLAKISASFHHSSREWKTTCL